MSRRKASQISKAEMVEMISELREVLCEARDDWDCDVSAIRHSIEEVLDKTSFDNDLTEIIGSVQDLEEVFGSIAPDNPLGLGLKSAMEEVGKVRICEELEQQKEELEVYIDEMCKKCGGSGKVPANNPADHAMFDPNSPDYLAYGKAGGMTTCRDCGGSGSRRKA